MARAMWKAQLELGGVEVPVRMYAAVQDRKVHFRVLEESKGAPVEQRMVDRESGDVVAREAIRRGYEVEPGVFTILTDEDLASIEPEPSRSIEVVAALDPEAIDAPYYDRPYWLGPDGDEGAYFAAAEALERSGKVAIVRWTLRKRRYVGALRAHQGYLMLSSLRYAGEVVAIDQLKEPPTAKVDAKEAELAAQLVQALEGELEFEEFRDEYRERVEQLVAAKAEGKTIRLKKARPKQAPDSLAASLKQSLEAAKKEKRVA